MKKFLAALALVSAVSFSTLAFNKEDVHYYVNEGNQQCYFVIDWYGTKKVWGFKWYSSGWKPNVFQALQLIDREDPRYKMAYTGMTDAYVDVYFMGYDEDDCACQWDLDNGGSSSSNALVAREDSVYWSQYWVFYQAGNRADLGTAPLYSSWTAANEVIVQNEKVYYFTIGCPEYDGDWNESPIEWDEAGLVMAENPFGWRIADSYITTTAANFKNPTNCLHRPTTYMVGSWGGVVSPYNPAWMANELLTLNSEDDYVVIEFDHRVVDDPKNPWGLDLIVFGNSLIQGTKKTYYEESSNPGNWEYTGNLAGEPAVVEVSADGKTWFSYTDGPFCDAWAPTQGWVYDPANVNTNLYKGNNWWSVPTDATWPVNPNMTANDVKGLTIETLSYRFDGSAGGAAFDISPFPLPTDENGRKYIKFVRVKPYYDEEEDEVTVPEVDAVADVRPCTEYEHWKLTNYTDWNTAWQTNLTSKTATAPNGYLNCVNQVLGLGASESPTIPAGGYTGEGSKGSFGDRLEFELAGLSPTENYTDLYFRSKKSLSSNCGVVIKQTSDLAGKWSTEIPSYQTPEQDDLGCYLNVLRVSNQGKFFKIAIED